MVSHTKQLARETAFHFISFQPVGVHQCWMGGVFIEILFVPVFRSVILLTRVSLGTGPPTSRLAFVLDKMVKPASKSQMRTRQRAAILHVQS